MSISEALRQEKIDAFELSIKDDKLKLSEFRQVKKSHSEPRLTDVERSEVTGY